MRVLQYWPSPAYGKRLGRGVMRFPPPDGACCGRLGTLASYFFLCELGRSCKKLQMPAYTSYCRALPSAP